MNAKEFKKLRKLVLDYTGISLGDNKQTLLESRLMKRLTALNLTTFTQYIEYLEEKSHDKERVTFVELISTNTTHFFRESEHFKILKKDLEQRISKGEKKIRLWCGAASTGQEPWSLMIIAREAGISSHFDFRMLATDINRTVLNTGKNGVYDHKEIESLPIKYKQKYFNKLADASGRFSVKESLKGQVSFAKFNLKDTPYPMSGPIDIIFIRNVMIYFDNDFREKIVAQAVRLLSKGGLLFVGHAESLAGNLITGLVKVAPSVFRKE